MLIFAKTILGVPEWQLLLVLLILPILSIVGTYFFLGFQRYFDVSTRNMVILTNILFALIPAYAMLGFKLDFGLKRGWEYWLTTGYYGFLIGAFLSFSGVLFSELIPKGKETEFFGLYEITDKGSAWIGPFLSALVTELTGDLRFAFVILLVMIITPVFLLLTVDVVQGRLDAEHVAANES
jgi:UMF1 family MFS transporter